MFFNNTKWSVRVGVVVLSGGLSVCHRPTRFLQF